MFSEKGLLWLVAALNLLGCATRSAEPRSRAGQSSTTPLVISSRPRERGVGAARAPDRESRSVETPAPVTGPASPRGTLSLAVPGFDPAVVSFPPTAAPPQPVIFVAHGAGDLPESQCQLWRAIVGDRAVIVCLSGPRTDVKTEPRYFPDHRVLERILVATLAAIRAAYGSVADTKNSIYAGYSQGATMGSLMIGSHAADFPRLALVEGGFDQWTARAVAAFKSGGGQRVLFACGTRHCQDRATTSARLFSAAGVESRVVSDASLGHAYGSKMEKLVRDSFDWFVAGDARFSPSE